MSLENRARWRLCRSRVTGLIVLLACLTGNASALGAPATSPTAAGSGEESPRQAGSVRLVLPPVIYAVPGIETNLFFDNAVLVLNPRSVAFDVRCDKGIQLKERWAFTPDVKDVGEYPIDVTVRDTTNAVVSHAHSVVRVSPKDRGGGGVMTLLLVGDSLTDYSVYPRHLYELGLLDDSLHFKLIGCRGPNNAPATGELRHEGYSGWTAEAFCTFHGPLSRSGQFKRPDTGSPFIYDDGADGKPHLDFARYCKTFNDGRGPDAITILLGTNDVFTATDENIDQITDKMLGYYDQLIEAFHQVRPDTRIGIVITTPPSRSQDGFRGYVGASKQTRVQYRRNQHRVVEKMIERYAGREAEQIYLVPAYLNLDTERNFPTATSKAAARSLSDVVRVTNGAHPSSEGYFQIADSLYCWLKAIAPASAVSPGTGSAGTGLTGNDKR
jgi:lysophospholipase L1-like esterase